MVSLRLLFTNGIRSHPCIINSVAKHWTHMGQRWYFKCSTATSQIAGAFLRNATKVRYNTDRSAAFCCCGDSNKERHLQRYKWILPAPHMQNVSGNMTNMMHYSQQKFNRFGTKSSPDLAKKSDAKSAPVTNAEADDILADSSKLGLFDRFKLIAKNYWYVLIPVHAIMSAGWLCAFYYLSQSGVDFEALLQYLHLSDNISEKVQGTSLGHWAVAFLCYKVISPVRYAITLGVTAMSIKYLAQQGYIKPMPTKGQLRHMMKAKKEALRTAAKLKRNNGRKIK